MANATNRYLEFLATRLAADPQLAAIVGVGGQRGVYKRSLPGRDSGSNAKPVLPYVTITLLSGPVTTGNGNLPGMKRPRVLVRIWSQDEGNLRNGADRIDAVMRSASGTQDGLAIGPAMLEEEVESDDALDGSPYIPYLGGRYRGFCQ